MQSLDFRHKGVKLQSWGSFQEVWEWPFFLQSFIQSCSSPSRTRYDRQLPCHPAPCAGLWLGPRAHAVKGQGRPQFFFFENTQEKRRKRPPHLWSHSEMYKWPISCLGQRKPERWGLPQGRESSTISNAFQISCRFPDWGSGESGALRAGLRTCSVALRLSDLDDFLSYS